MIVKTNLIDLNKITSENYAKYNKKIEYEIFKQCMLKKNKVKPKGIVKSAEERKQQLKKYQHNYYLTVTKIKRKLAREDKQ